MTTEPETHLPTASLLALLAVLILHACLARLCSNKRISISFPTDKLTPSTPTQISLSRQSRQAIPNKPQRSYSQSWISPTSTSSSSCLLASSLIWLPLSMREGSRVPAKISELLTTPLSCLLNAGLVMDPTDKAPSIWTNGEYPLTIKLKARIC